MFYHHINTAFYWIEGRGFRGYCDGIHLPDISRNRISVDCWLSSILYSSASDCQISQPWLYPAEITTTRIRARGSAISSFFNWMCVFAVVKITPIGAFDHVHCPANAEHNPSAHSAINNIGWRIFIPFAIFNACWVPLVYLVFPETKGLELEDIDHIFDKGGFTGGVWYSPGGRTVGRHRVIQDVDVREDTMEKEA